MEAYTGIAKNVLFYYYSSSSPSSQPASSNTVRCLAELLLARRTYVCLDPWSPGRCGEFVDKHCTVFVLFGNPMLGSGEAVQTYVCIAERNPVLLGRDATDGSLRLHRVFFFSSRSASENTVRCLSELLLSRCMYVCLASLLSVVGTNVRVEAGGNHCTVIVPLYMVPRFVGAWRGVSRRPSASPVISQVGG